MLKILQILIMLSEIYSMKKVDDKDEFLSFTIECLNSKNVKIVATINIWAKKMTNPTIINITTNEPYTYEGTYNVVYMEYKDSENKIFKTEDIRTFDVFYKLYRMTENENIKMLIKGCSLEYYMVKFLTNTWLTMRLYLGQRVDYKTPTVSLFEEEKDVEKVVTIEKQKAYYNQWLKSIEGLPY